MIFTKLQRAEDRYREIEQAMTLPEVASDAKEYARLIKEYKSLEPIIEKYREYKSACDTMSGAEEIMRDGSLEPELRELAEEEYHEYRDLCDKITEELKILLMPRDPNDSRNVTVEIRQGAGGEEAALFGADLYRMYTMYSDSRRFKVEVVSRNETELGGIKEITFN
ncbi:MAG: PCRF domain-containing protein, partial [Clostridia bacterium]|nr:PCRF domain-containing protein [Clostridia bacterium]